MGAAEPVPGLAVPAQPPWDRSGVREGGAARLGSAGCCQEVWGGRGLGGKGRLGGDRG